MHPDLFGCIIFFSASYFCTLMGSYFYLAVQIIPEIQKMEVIKKFVLILLPVFFSFSAAGQLRNISHKTYDLSDSLQVIQLSIVDPLRWEFWAGDKILLETRLKLLNSSPSILEFLLEDGRYEVVATKEGEVLTLSSKNKKRPGMTYKGKMTEEFVDMRLFIPDAFTNMSDSSFRRIK